MDLIIVDDEPKIRKGLSRILSMHPGWVVKGSFGDAKSALNFLNECHVDVAITDIRMPGLTGLEMIEKMKALDPTVYFVILSGYGRFEYAQRAIDMGVKKFLTKPTSPEELTKALEQIELELLSGQKRSTLSEIETNNLLVHRAQEYIDLNYQKKFTLKDMAAALYISPNYLSDQFKKHTGMKFTDYLLEVRMEKSKEYLRDIRYSVGDVAGLVGFSDPHYFSLTFRRYYEMTPMEYRRSCAVCGKKSGELQE